MDSGKNASFTFGGTTYDSDDCLQGSANLNDAVNMALYQCSGYQKGVPGTRTIKFTVSLALSKTDTTKVSALAPTTTGTFEFHPAGDTATYIECTSTNATVESRPISAEIDGIIATDVTFHLDDITYQAAA